MNTGSRPASCRVICLCAQWCNVCRDWRETFTQAAAAHPHLDFAWVDVEDESDAMGDVEIDTFPTLLIARDGRPVFLGPVQPSGPQLNRLLASMLQPSSAATAEPLEAAVLLQRLLPVLPKP